MLSKHNLLEYLKNAGHVRATHKNAFLSLKALAGVSELGMLDVKQLSASLDDYATKLLAEHEHLTDVLHRVLSDIQFVPGDEARIPFYAARRTEDRILSAAKLMASNKARISLSPTDLRENVAEHMKSVYHLYRMLQAACGKVLTLNSISEDGLSTELIKELQYFQLLAKNSNQHEDLSFEFHSFFDKLKPAVQEKGVGADFAIIAAGEALLGRVGLRIIWVQAKRPGSKDFEVKIRRGTAKSKYCMYRQATALLAMDSGDGRSSSIYAIYGKSITDLDAVWSDDIAVAKSENFLQLSALAYGCSTTLDSGKCSIHKDVAAKWDIGNSCSRFPEHVVSLLRRDGDVFETVDDVRRFLAEYGVGSAKHVVAITPTGDELAAKLVSVAINSLVDIQRRKLTTGPK